VKALAYLAILLIPESLVLLYLTHGNHIPESDGGEYLLYAYRVYDRLRHGGLWEGLSGIYLIRGWKPTIFPVLLTPFLFLTGGRLYPALSAAVVFVTGYTTLYAFVLLKEKLSALSAAIGAAFVTALPVFLFLSLDLYSEIAMPGLVIGIIYHLLKSRDFSSLTHTLAAALLAALALCIRSDQMLLTLTPVLVIAVGAAAFKRVIRAKDVLLCGLAPVFTAGIVLAKIVSTAGLNSFPSTGAGGAAFLLTLLDRLLMLAAAALALSALVAVVVAVRTRTAAHTVLCFVLVMCVLPLAWYYQFALTLFEWMYRCTVGDLAQRSPGGQVLGSFWAHSGALVAESGTFVIVSACTVAALGLLAGRDPSWDSTGRSYERRAVTYLLASASGLFVLMLLGTGLSPAFWAGDPYRRLMGPFSVSILALVMIGLRAGRYLAWRQGIAVLLLGTQAVAIGMKSTGIDRGPGRNRIFTAGLIRPRLIEPEPNGEVIATLNRLGTTEAVKVVDIEGYNDVSVGGVLLVSEAMHPGFTVGHDYLTKYAGRGDLDDFARRFTHMVFSITPPTYGTKEQMAGTIARFRNTQHPNYLRLADILELLDSGELPQYGLEPIRTVVFGQSEVFFLRSLVFGHDAAAAAAPGARAIATNNQLGSVIGNLNDGTPAPWGSAESGEDVYAGLLLAAPQAARELAITVFAPSNLQHLRDISVVAADSEGPGGPVWHVIGSRVAGARVFAKKTTVPQVADGTVVRVEIDTGDPDWRPYKIWGIACFSGSKGYLRNYLPSGLGIYIRELQLR
jgi:hypothetical protein